MVQYVGILFPSKRMQRVELCFVAMALLGSGGNVTELDVLLLFKSACFRCSSGRSLHVELGVLEKIIKQGRQESVVAGTGDFVQIKK